MGEDPHAGEYRAFLSYSHRDRAAARRIHRRLERYRLPKRLRAEAAAARLTPVFRDREELPAAGDLTQEIRDALARSRALVIVCSPAARASPWVAREIDVFRALHPDRPILAALIEGEPADAFPPNLAAGGIEPIAADFRRGGDGARLGLLKLVAGLSGVGLDALVQRDAQRQVRRVTAITLGAGAAVVAMAFLLLLAVNARRDAEHQRAEAEGLIEFMLTDLRTRLKGVGRLDVMEAVNARAIAYYDRQLGRLPDESLERLARVWHAAGEDDLNRGSFAAALVWFRQAHAATAAALSRHPLDAEAIFAHAQSDYWIGRVHELRREWPEAMHQYVRYAVAGKRLVAIDSSNPDYMMERGWGSYNLGIVRLRGFNHPASAASLFEEAGDWFGKAASSRPADPAIQKSLGQAHAWLADCYAASKQFAASLAARQRQLSIAEKLLRADPASAERQFQVAVAEWGVARMALSAGQTAIAPTTSETALRQANQLVAKDPANSEWLLLKTKIECDMFAAGSKLGNIRKPILTRSIKRSIEILKQRGRYGFSEIPRCIASMSNV